MTVTDTAVAQSQKINIEKEIVSLAAVYPIHLIEPLSQNMTRITRVAATSKMMVVEKRLLCLLNLASRRM